MSVNAKSLHASVSSEHAITRYQQTTPSEARIKPNLNQKENNNQKLRIIIDTIPGCIILQCVLGSLTL